MPKVIATHGNIVTYELLGVGEVIRKLREMGKEIESNADLGVIKAAAFVQEEVKESVAGNRAETRSVDTGHFVNDISVEKVAKAVAKVSAPDTDYAIFLEYGTSFMLPRSHFRNTLLRNENKIKDIINNEIKLGIV